MSDKVDSPDMHKSTALRFIGNANETLDKPLDNDLLGRCMTCLLLLIVIQPTFSVNLKKLLLGNEF